MRRKAPVTDLSGAPDAARWVRFHAEAAQLKQLYRQGWLRAGVPAERCESVAEHSFGVALLALSLAGTRFPDLDAGRVLRLALVHDLSEVFAGDITVHDGVAPAEKSRRERASIRRLLDGLPGGDGLLALWEEYEDQASPEAVLVHQLDRLEMALQALAYERQEGLDLQEFVDSARQSAAWDEVGKLLDEVDAARRR
jgi:putative hydrolase of HD superfamily